MRFLYSRDKDKFILLDLNVKIALDAETLLAMIEYRNNVRAPRSEYEGYTGPTGPDLT